MKDTGATSSNTSRRWVVLAASTLAMLLTSNGNFHGGVMKVLIMTHLDSDVNMVTWVVAYYTMLFGIAAPLASVVIQVSSCRTCVVTSGLLCLLGFVLSSLVTDVILLFLTLTLVGVGQALCMAGSILVLGYYFPEHSSVAVGVSVGGGALALFLHPPLLQVLGESYGLQGALMMSGAIAFHASAFGAVMAPCSLELKVSQGNRGGNVLQKLCALCANGVRSIRGSPVTSRAMATLLLSSFLFSFSYHFFIIFVPYYLVHDGGLTPLDASFTVSVMGIGNFLSRLTAGVLAQEPAIGPRLSYSGLLGMSFLVALTAPSLVAQGLVGAYAFNFLFGLYSGGCMGLIFPVTLEVVGVHHCTTAYGVAMCALGVGGMLGAPLLELVFQETSSPDTMFGLAGVLLCIAGVLGFSLTRAPSADNLTNDPADPNPKSSPDQRKRHLGEDVEIQLTAQRQTNDALFHESSLNPLLGQNSIKEGSELPSIEIQSSSSSCSERAELAEHDSLVGFERG